jgi:hypothetical protein
VALESFDPVSLSRNSEGRMAAEPGSRRPHPIGLELLARADQASRKAPVRFLAKSFKGL